MNNFMPISERPNAKMAYYGAAALSNAELLSLILRTGTKEKSAVELANDVLEYTYENIGDFGTAEVHELSEIYGIGESKACAVVAAIELSKRLQADKIAGIKTRIRDAKQIAEMLMPQLLYEKQEYFVAVYLNSKMQIEFQKTISIGTLDSAPVHPRDVLAPAISRKSAAFVVAHNHPTGDSSPSGPDISLTNRLIAASEIVGIKLIDHVILGNGCWTSLKEEGICEFK